jgi:hypothetical protein
MLTTLFFRGGNESDAVVINDGVSGGINKRRRINIKYYQAPLALLVILLGR